MYSALFSIEAAAKARKTARRILVREIKDFDSGQTMLRPAKLTITATENISTNEVDIGMKNRSP